MADPPSPEHRPTDPPADAPGSNDREGSPGEDASTPSGTGGLFETAHLHADLRTRAVRGGTVTLLGQAGDIVLRIIGLAILARLLLPDDFGLIYGVLAVTGFVTLFREAGLATATIQRQHVTPAQISTLFWINVGLGIAVAGVIVALAPALAWVYDDPRAMGATLALAGTAVIAGFGIQHHALLRRQMRFGVTTSIQVASAAVGLTAAVIAAWYGAGYWALIVEFYGATLTRVVLMNLACGWRPGPPRRGTGVRPMIRFGTQLTGSSLLDYLKRNADNFLIATFIGTGPLGFYGNAYRLLAFPLMTMNLPLTGVAIPTLSRLQHDPERFARFYYRAIALLVFVGMPIVGFAFAEAPRLVELVLGRDWLPAADIFRALAPAAFLGTFNIATGWVFVSLGQTGRQLRWNVLSTFATLAAFVAGLPWGAIGVAAAFSIVQVIERWPALWYCYHGTFLRLRDLGATLVRPATASILAAAGTLGAQWLLATQWLLIFELAFAGVVYVALYLVLWVLMPGGRATLMAMLRTIEDLRRRREA